MIKTTFSTKLSAFGNNTGIEIPDVNAAELGTNKRPPVKVQVNDYVFQSTLAVMGGKNLISFSKAHRESSGIAAGDNIKVTLILEEGPREVDVPNELQSSLESHNLLGLFSSLAYSKRKEFARQVNDAKTDETRERRILKIIEALNG